MFETYAILDPRYPGKYSYTNISFLFRPFYIGKGRMQQNRKFKRKNKQAEGIIKNIKKHNLQPLYVTLNVFNDEVMCLNEEKRLIAEIGRKDLKKGPLLNFTDGGEGCSGVKLTKEAIESRRQRMSLFWANKTLKERKQIGRLSLLNRDPERVKIGCIKASITKNKKTKKVKRDIEQRRFKKWCEKIYNMSEDKKTLRSKKCSIAANKKKVVFLQIEILNSNTLELKNNNIYTKNIKQWQQLGVPRDVATTMWKTSNNKICKTRQGLIYRVKGGFLGNRHNVFNPVLSVS